MHFIARQDESQEEAAGYAQVETSGSTASAELAVDPDHRRRGIGSGLVDSITAALGPEVTRLLVWAHGDLASASSFAESLGFTRDRVLYQLSRSLDGFEWPQAWPEGAPESWPTGGGAAVRLPEGAALRAFQPGRDDEEWLRVNAAAFADHPEQGRWSAEDLADRLAEPWFDPEGLLVAVDSAGMLGFHWTKIEDGIGEIYVLGVDPRAQGTGLGKALTLAGLAHMAARGIRQVDLYTDESNGRAVRLYRSQGFDIARSDVQWARSLA